MPDPTPVETKLRIAHQDFGAAKKRDTAINAREYRIGSGELCSDVIGDAILRVVKPAARPVARTLGLQPPDDREAAERPLPQFRIWIEVSPLGAAVPSSAATFSIVTSCWRSRGDLGSGPAAVTGGSGAGAPRLSPVVSTAPGNFRWPGHKPKGWRFSVPAQSTGGFDRLMPTRRGIAVAQDAQKSNPGLPTTRKSGECRPKREGEDEKLAS